MKNYPCITVNLDAIKQNAKVVCDICNKNGITVAGVVKFSDGDLKVSKAYADGGCAQLAVSRAVHLKSLKENFPNKEILLTRAPVRSELGLVASFADLSLHSDKDILVALDKKAGELKKNPGIILMLDVGDLREGVDNVDELLELALLVENSLPNLSLRGVGTNLACLNGVLPSFENLSFLVQAAETIENAIGRKLDFISGGSSINMTMLPKGENKMPPRVNHLRIGGFIANPTNMRLNRNVSYDGMREDSIEFSAEIIEIHEKASAPKALSTKNWAGEAVTVVDKGRRKRAILAVGGQDIGGYSMLMPKEEGVEVVGGSSDHTIVDLTESKKEWRSGDVISFKTKYAAMLYSFTGKHVEVEYVYDKD